MQQQSLSKEPQAKETNRQHPNRIGHRHRPTRHCQRNQYQDGNDGNRKTVGNESNVQKDYRATDGCNHVERTKLAIRQVVVAADVFAEERNEKRLPKPGEQRKQKRAG